MKMKKLYILFPAIIIASAIFAQSPQSFSYQAVLRNADGSVIANQPATVVIEILQGNNDGTAVFTEIHNITTSPEGVINLSIGSEEDLSVVDWSSDSHFLRVTVNGVVIGITQMLSVPYALHAKTASSTDETDPVFNAWDKSTGIAITEAQITDLQNYLSEESDPNFNSSVAGGITANDTTNWNSKLDSYTEVDPVFDESVAKGITANDTASWNSKLEEFTETDPQFSAWDKSTGIQITESQISDLGTYLETETQNLDNVLTQNNSANNKNIINLANPVNAQDVATKAYVDELISLFEGNGMVVVDFTVDNTDISLGNSVVFTDNSVLAATNWQWDFGDGNTSTEQNPSYTYTAEGTYTVSLTASNGVLRATKTKTDYITVTDEPTYGTFTDSRDGNVYQTIMIGNQEWMAENLKYLPSVVDPGTGSNTTAYYYVYDYNGTDVTAAKATSNYSTYGVLFNWPAAMAGSASSTANPSGVQGVCPTGWHLPSDAEWTELTDYLGGESVAGGKLKETVTTHWDSPNVGATNETGFTALPGGLRSDEDCFNDIGLCGYWWSSTERSTSEAWGRDLIYDSSNLGTNGGYKEPGFSIRCVKD